MDRNRKLSIISFTGKGKRLSQTIEEQLTDIEVSLFTKHKPDIGEEGSQWVPYVENSVGQWAKEQMEKGNAMLFIGACGIAVRAAAPYVTDKLYDSPILVMDEHAKHVIPLLAGHMGGANGLARFIGRKTGAEPVITTATDINGIFAIDLFAKRNGLLITNRQGIARVSSKALDRKTITISIEPGHRKQDSLMPEGVCITDYPPACPADVVITSQEYEYDTELLLKPKEYVIGMGCRRGKERTEIQAFILRELDRVGICLCQVYALASIDQKRNEQGLAEWCRREKIPFVTYTAQELKEIKGTFGSSLFVEETVGVDNVCERAALKACGWGGKLICEKRAENGMTFAAAKREWMVDFDEE